MNISRIISYVLILLGGIVALFAQAQESQNTYVLIGGIALLMTGIYRISRNISSRNDNELNDEEE